jgi:peptidoglycan hydrolase FlgJ
MSATTPIMPLPAFSAPASLDFDATVANGSRPTVRAAAREMETMFLSMLLKQMRESNESEGEGLFPGDNGDVYGGLFDFYMSKHLAGAGGMGLGSLLADQLEGKQLKESHQYAPIPATASPGASLPRTSSF